MHPDGSDWAGARRIAADGPPSAMSPQHMRRARAFVAAYIGMAALCVLFAHITTSDRGGIYLATLAVAALLVLTAIRGAINGRFARWTSPLDALAPKDATRIRIAVYNPDRIPAAEGRELVGLIAAQFMFGNTLRIGLAVEVAVLFGLLAARALGHPVLALCLGGFAVLNIVLAGMELHRRRGVEATLRVLRTDYQG